MTGATLVVGCWRIARNRRQPSHFMFGFGKLFALLNDDHQPFHLDNVVFFQCPDHQVGPKTDFFNAVWNIIHDSGRHSGWFNHSTRFFSVGKDETRPLLCADSIYFDHHVGYSLGQNADITISAWRRNIQRYLDNVPADASSFSKGGNQTRTCGRHKLRIAIFFRSEGSALRKFSNLNDVLQVAENITPEVRMVTLNSNSTFVEAVDYFNSFDILITPHGSHLTSGILISENARPSIIEVVATCVNDDFRKNLENHFAHYRISVGHVPHDDEITTLISGCHERHGQTECSTSEQCSFGALRASVQADLYVNTSILRTELELAVEEQLKLCKERKEKVSKR